MSEPVTKTSRSETFSSCLDVWPAGVSASEEVTHRRNRDAIAGNISVSTFAECFRRILTEHVIAPNRDGRAFYQPLPSQNTIVTGLSGGRLYFLSVLATSYVFRVLGIAGYWLRLNRKKSG